MHDKIVEKKIFKITTNDESELSQVNLKKRAEKLGCKIKFSVWRNAASVKIHEL